MNNEDETFRTLKKWPKKDVQDSYSKIIQYVPSSDIPMYREVILNMLDSSNWTIEEFCDILEDNDMFESEERKELFRKVMS